MARPGPRPIPARERFWPKVTMTVGGCWVWRAALNTQGYGSFFAGPDRGVVGAHCFAYELMIGPVPPGLELDHLCRNRRCVCPLHMDPVTHDENVQRADNRKPQLTHCKRGHALAGDNVRLVHRASGRVERWCRTCANARQRRHDLSAS